MAWVTPRRFPPAPPPIMAQGTVFVPSDAAEAEAAVTAASGSCVVNFCASWCEPCVDLNAVFSELAEEHVALRFVQVREPVAAHLPARVSLCRASLTPRLAGRSSMPITSRSYATASRSSPCRRSSFCTRAS